MGEWVVRIVPVIVGAFGDDGGLVDVDGFEAWLRDRDRAELVWLIGAIAATTDTPDGEVERLRATREVVRLLQRRGRRRQAREAQHEVRLCALAVCTDRGIREGDRAGTTHMARAAGDAARALVADPDAPCSEILIRPFLGAPLHRAG
ncbi:hypothetical protein [Actinospongicola halichondriae]|uniref:hypothetical protein n=1 Tax=Actinospongicola halichondriae TaxID=3236844 RepID=UPI003D3914C5